MRDAAQKTYGLFRADPEHPSLHFKKVHNRDPVHSVRISLGYRALALLEGDEVVRFWIGSHADYDRLLRRM